MFLVKLKHFLSFEEYFIYVLTLVSNYVTTRCLSSFNNHTRSSFYFLLLQLFNRDPRNRDIEWFILAAQPYEPDIGQKERTRYLWLIRRYTQHILIFVYHLLLGEGYQIMIFRYHTPCLYFSIQLGLFVRRVDILHQIEDMAVLLEWGCENEFIARVLIFPFHENIVNDAVFPWSFVALNTEDALIAHWQINFRIIHLVPNATNICSMKTAILSWIALRILNHVTLADYFLSNRRFEQGGWNIKFNLMIVPNKRVTHLL